MRATERYLPLVLCIMPYKVVLTFEFVDQILKTSESYWAVLSGGTVYYAVQGDSTFLSLWVKSGWSVTWMLFPQMQAQVLFTMLYKCFFLL